MVESGLVCATSTKEFISTMAQKTILVILGRKRVILEVTKVLSPKVVFLNHHWTFIQAWVVEYISYGYSSHRSPSWNNYYQFVELMLQLSLTKSPSISSDGSTYVHLRFSDKNFMRGVTFRWQNPEKFFETLAKRTSARYGITNKPNVDQSWLRYSWSVSDFISIFIYYRSKWAMLSAWKDVAGFPVHSSWSCWTQNCPILGDEWESFDLHMMQNVKKEDAARAVGRPKGILGMG